MALVYQWTPSDVAALIGATAGLIGAITTAIVAVIRATRGESVANAASERSLFVRDRQMVNEDRLSSMEAQVVTLKEQTGVSNGVAHSAGPTPDSTGK